MARISLTEQYDNKDVIAQIYDVKETNVALQESVDEALNYMSQAVDQIDAAIDAAEQATNKVNELTTRTVAIEDSLGGPGTGSDASGTAYQRIAKNVDDIAVLNNDVSTLETTVGGNTAGLVKKVNDNASNIATQTSIVSGHTTAIGALQTTVGDNSGGLVKQVSDNTGNIQTISTDVGALKTTVGNNSAGLVKQVGDNTSAIQSMSSDVSGLVTTVGDASNGLVKQVNTNTSDISTNADAIALHTTAIGDLNTDVGNIKPVITALPTTYQLRTEKDQLNGYAGLSSAGKVATSQLDTGINLNQVLLAGAQLNTGEFLYIGAGGVIRSRVIGEGVEYVGNYASLAALEAYPDPQNGDFGTVYGTVSDDGFYMYDGANWNKVMLFDITDYELVANKVTGISSASTNTEYPSAKAVYDYDKANDVASVDVTQTTAAGKITIGVSLANVNDSPIASDSVDIPTTASATTGSNVPITSGGVYTALTNGLATKQATLVVGTNLDAVPTNGSNYPVTSDGVYDAIATVNTNKQDKLVVGTNLDATPTNGSNYPVTSDGVYDALALKQNTLTFDTAPTASSTNPVESGGVYTAITNGLSGKQATLVVGTNLDASPTDGSNNPVTSNGVYDALTGKQATLVGSGAGQNIKTINNTSIVGSGNVSVQPVIASSTVTLASANWSSHSQTITGLSQVTATNIVWVSPASASFDEYGACGIRVTAQASGSLTFTTNGTDPTSNLSVIVVGA